MPIDYGQYPPDWKERRARILERAGNRCEFCGVENHAYILRKRGDWVYLTEREVCENGITDKRLYAKNLTRVVLTIAHLDNDKENWNVRDDRLAALCQRCHLGIDLKHHMSKAVLTRDRKRGQMRFEFAQASPVLPASDRGIHESTE